MKAQDIEKTAGDLVSWLQDLLKKTGAQGFVFGLSGGIDSAVVAAAARAATPHAVGVIMPCESNPEDEAHARLVAQAIDLTTERVDLTETYHALKVALPVISHEMALANLKPRLRMTTLYAYAQAHNLLVLAGSNRSEFYTGYFTKFGDSACDAFPIADLLKREVYALARYFAIPMEIIEKKPTAGLWEGQTDEEEMGFSYDVLDAYIAGEADPDPETKEKIDGMHRRSAHKRVFPPIFRA